jgi:predicted nucleotidyltransferase component of viral defense system
LNEDDFDTVTKAFSEVAASVAEETGMVFSYQRPDRVPHENSHTFYMGFTGPMGRAREFKVDVTRTESIVANLERKRVIVTYPVFDFPGDCAVKVYSIDEIVTEKLLALTDPKRTQPRDLFDVWILATDAGFGLDRLAYPIAQKLRFRGRSAEDLSAAFDKKEKALEKTWGTRLDAQMSKTPKFETVFREAKATLSSPSKAGQLHAMAFFASM